MNPARIMAAAAAIAMLSACTAVRPPKEGDPAKKTLEKMQQTAVARHLAGDSAQLLAHLANSVKNNAEKRHSIPDYLRLLQEDDTAAGDDLARKLLWESVLLCTAQFSHDPEKTVRDFVIGELKTRSAVIIAESQFLNSILWKSQAQQLRAREIRSELLSLFGTAQDDVFRNIPLPVPAEENFSLPETLPTETDSTPTDLLQYAAVIFSIPDEIRMQTLADPDFDTLGVITEITQLAAKHIISMGYDRMNSAKNAYAADPSAENLFEYRKWYYTVMLDISRSPDTETAEKDKDFVRSMMMLRSNL